MLVKVTRKQNFTIGVLEGDHFCYFDSFWFNADGVGFSYCDARSDGLRFTKDECIQLAGLIDTHCSRLGLNIVLAVLEVEVR